MGELGHASKAGAKKGADSSFKTSRKEDAILSLHQSAWETFCRHLLSFFSKASAATVTTVLHIRICIWRSRSKMKANIHSPVTGNNSATEKPLRRLKRKSLHACFCFSLPFSSLMKTISKAGWLKSQRRVTVKAQTSYFNTGWNFPPIWKSAYECASFHQLGLTATEARKLLCLMPNHFLHSSEIENDS